MEKMIKYYNNKLLETCKDINNAKTKEEFILLSNIRKEYEKLIQYFINF